MDQDSNTSPILVFHSYEQYQKALIRGNGIDWFNKPFIIKNGTWCNYYLNGLQHREDGPAVCVTQNITRALDEYWLNGNFLFDYSWLEQNNLPHPTDLKTILKYKKLLMLE